jgi:MFS family permease
MLASKIPNIRPSPETTQPGETLAARWLALLRDGNALISVMMVGSVAIHALSMRVVSTALPSIVMEIGGLRFFAWTTTVAVVSAIWGAGFVAFLVRSRGLRDAYRLSLVLFASGSIACAVAPNMAVLLTGRLFQGLGGGLLTGLSYTTIRRVFPENLRTRAIVLVSGIWGVAALSGPMLGGLLAGWGLWRWAFWIDVPFALGVGVLAEFTLSTPTEPQSGGLPVRPATACARLALLTGSALTISIGSVSGQVLLNGTGLVLGTLLLVRLLRVEQVSAAGSTFRLLPSGAYRPGNVLGAVSLTMALMAGSSTAAVLYVPYVVTQVGGHPPIVGGYLGALVSLSWTFTAFLTASAEGVWADRSIILGAASICVGLIIATSSLICGFFFFLMAFGIALTGGGIGFAWAHLCNRMMAYANKAERDISSSFIYTNQMIASAFASALAGMIANLAGFADRAVGPRTIVQSVAWVFVSSAAFAAATIPMSIISVRLSRSLQPATDD